MKTKYYEEDDDDEYLSNYRYVKSRIPKTESKKRTQKQRWDDDYGDYYYEK